MTTTSQTRTPGGVVPPAARPGHDDQVAGPHLAVRTAFLVLVCVAMLLIAIYAALGVVQARTGGSFPVPLFDLDAELTLGSWYSSALLLIAALLLSLVALVTGSRGGRDTRWWAGLAGGFVLLSLDEGIDLHNRLTTPVAGALGLEDGALRSAWVLPAIVGVLVTLGVFVPFLRRLTPRLRGMLLLCASVYVLGAVGLEIAAQAIVTTEGAGVVTGLLNLLEELMEMDGVLGLIAVVGGHLAQQLAGGPLVLQLGRSGAPEPGATS